MSRTISANSYSLRTYGGFASRQRKKTDFQGRILSMKGEKTEKGERKVKGSIKLGLIGICFAVTGVILISGAFYLYQVNDLATKGYEMRDVESRIQELEKESKKMQIREVELRSMYNIEKATNDLNLVNSQNITYLEMDSPVAMNN